MKCARCNEAFSEDEKHSGLMVCITHNDRTVRFHMDCNRMILVEYLVIHVDELKET